MLHSELIDTASKFNLKCNFNCSECILSSYCSLDDYVGYDTEDTLLCIYVEVMGGRSLKRPLSLLILLLLVNLLCSVIRLTNETLETLMELWTAPDNINRLYIKLSKEAFVK